MVRVPARLANSDCEIVGKAYCRPSFCESHAQNARESLAVMKCTGHCGEGVYVGFFQFHSVRRTVFAPSWPQPPLATHSATYRVSLTNCANCPWVTSCVPR